MQGRTSSETVDGAVSINAVMVQVLEQLRHSQQHTVDLATWRNIAGLALAAHSTPETCEHGRLTVRVDRPGPFFLLHLKRRDLLRRLQQRLGPGAIEELAFRLGPRA